MKGVVGFPTLPGQKEENHAKNLLVIQTCGVLNPYKFVIAWELTAETLNSSSLIKLVNTCVSQLIEGGMRIRAITTDMGPRNMNL